jgi:phosphohistidine phosphatase
MKEIIFVRHAKSDWGYEGLKDIDRPLNERGYGDAYFSSEWYAKNKPAPHLIISSTATRAYNTAQIFFRAMQLEPRQFQLEKQIYESSVDDLYEVIQSVPSHVSRLMLFGHNPGFTNICNEISDEHFFDNVPTCGIVCFQLDIISWNQPIKAKGKLLYYQFPKEFKTRQ